MPTWPSDLPQTPDPNSYTESPQSRVLRSSMDAGPPKTRRRFTAGTRIVPVRYVMSKGQIGIFESFFEDSIQDGALAFDWPNPRTGSLESAMIVGDPPYTITAVAGLPWWWVSFNIEIQP